MGRLLQNTNSLKVAGAAVFLVFAFLGLINLGKLFPEKYSRFEANAASLSLLATTSPKIVPVLDTAAYDLKLRQLAQLKVSTTTSTSTLAYASTSVKRLWPVKTVYPNAGAILPFKRVVAYYGNLYSKNMGVLGQYPPAEMLARLEKEVKKWE